MFRKSTGLFKSFYKHTRSAYNVIDNFDRQDFLLSLKKKALLFKGILIKKRYFALNFPIGGRRIHSFSLSDVCGHLSFGFLALSYLEKDFFSLRIYAMSGITLSIVFQYYREKPLWIPIRWNTMFLIINSVMVFLILKESNDAENMPYEQKRIYTQVFQDHGMKTIDFLHLMSIAERREVKKGEKLVSLGSKHHHLHFVQAGRLSVRRRNETMPEIHEV